MTDSTGTNSGGKRAVIYVRVSSIGGRDVESAAYQTEEVQEAKCRLFAQLHDLDVLDVVVDRDVSGRKWDRKGLNRVMKMVRGREVDTVIVYMLSRLGRNLKGALEVVEVMQDHDVNLLSPVDQIDLSSAIGKMFLSIMLTFAQYESDLRGENWRTSQAQALGRGVAALKTPFGYRKVVGGRNAGKFEEHPVEAPLVREMFRRRANGDTYAELARYLDAEYPRTDGTKWDGSWVEKRLKNRVYLGELNVTVDKKPVRVEGTHPALVDETTFVAASVARVRQPVVNKGSHDFILSSGILLCAGCGNPMVGQSRESTGDAPSYVCRRRSRFGPCPAPATVKAASAEEYVVGVVEEHLRAMGKVLKGRPRVKGDALALEQAAERAEADTLKVASDLALKSAIGEVAWEEMVRAHARDRDEKRRLANAARNESDLAKVLALDVDAVLADPKLLRGALEAAVVDARCVRGRGMRIEDRVTVTLADSLDAPDVAGVALVQ